VTMLTITVDEKDAEILARALDTSHTWLLDAWGEAIRQGSSTEPHQEKRKRILALSAKLGRPIDDSYRMGHLADFAKKKLEESYR
jgi:hypothetical protein